MNEAKVREILAGMFAQQTQTELQEALLHYISLRVNGGFGVKVASALASTMVLQDYVKQTVKSHSGADAYLEQHAKFMQVLSSHGEAAVEKIQKSRGVA